jgi:hypothetical protein
MKQKIVKPDGSEYFTVEMDKDSIHFRNFGREHTTVTFSNKVLDQLVPFLNEANFWRKVSKEKHDETHD